MGNQPWPQFQSGIRERSVAHIEIRFTFQFLQEHREQSICRFGSQFYHINCRAMYSSNLYGGGGGGGHIKQAMTASKLKVTVADFGNKKLTMR